MTIPLLDLQNLRSSALDAACREWGFFALRGHAIDKTLCAEAISHAHRFFTRPSEFKNTIRRSADNAWGFYDAELTKNRRDWKEIIDIGPEVESGPLAGAHPQWPAQSGFQPCIEALTAQMHSVALQLVEAIAEALQVEADLSAPFREHSSFLRLNYYPPCPQPAPADAGFVPAHGELGISHHTDAGAVTVLLQDTQPGLQVFRDDRWYTVPPIEDALIINIGDIVQVWSNDRYAAPLHRVLANTTHARVSIPYFLNPSYDYDYAPLAAALAPAEAPHYRPINWGTFRQQRSAGDYADYGAEVQISDFQI